MHDIIVVGAGPAGATLCRLLPAGLSVLLLDRGSGGEKCCGGLIAPDAQKLLARFDLGIPRELVSDPQLFYVRSVDLETGREGRYQRHYTNVNRGRLDRYTLELLPATVERRTGCLYRGHRETGGRLVVSVRSGETDEELECRVLVGADGAQSRVRQSIYGDFSRLRRYLAIQGSYRLRQPIRHYAVFFDRRLTDFYSWLIPKDDTVLVGGAFSLEGRPRARFDALVEAVKAGGYGLGERIKLEACLLLRPRLRDLKTGKSGVALIGEAAGFISPSSSEGLSYAYESARLLAQAWDHDPGRWLERYRRSCARLRLNISFKNLKGLFMYSHALRNLIFRTGLGGLGRKAGA